MSRSKAYVLDANVFITAHQSYYRFDVCPGIWTALLREHEHKRVVSIDRVRDELVDLGDELSRWTNDALRRSSRGRLIRRSSTSLAA